MSQASEQFFLDNQFFCTSVVPSVDPKGYPDTFYKISFWEEEDQRAISTMDISSVAYKVLESNKKDILIPRLLHELWRTGRSADIDYCVNYISTSWGSNRLKESIKLFVPSLKDAYTRSPKYLRILSNAPMGVLIANFLEQIFIRQYSDSDRYSDKTKNAIETDIIRLLKDNEIPLVSV